MIHTHVSRVAPDWDLSDPLLTELQRRGKLLTQRRFETNAKNAKRFFCLPGVVLLLIGSQQWKNESGRKSVLIFFSRGCKWSSPLRLCRKNWIKTVKVKSIQLSSSIFPPSKCKKMNLFFRRNFRRRRFVSREPVSLTHRRSDAMTQWRTRETDWRISPYCLTSRSFVRPPLAAAAAASPGNGTDRHLLA